MSRTIKKSSRVWMCTGRSGPRSKEILITISQAASRRICAIVCATSTLEIYARIEKGNMQMKNPDVHKTLHA